MAAKAKSVKSKSKKPVKVKKTAMVSSMSATEVKELRKELSFVELFGVAVMVILGALTVVAIYLSVMNSAAPTM